MFKSIYRKIGCQLLRIFTSEKILQISKAIHYEANLNQYEPIRNLKFLQFFRQQSQLNLKAIRNQYEMWNSNLKYEESIWTNLNQYGIWSFYNFSDLQSEMNLKQIWSKSEVWKVTLKLVSREKSILHNLKLELREKLLIHNLKLN